MQAESVNFARVISGERTFSIPVFQRNYDWSKKQCLQLFMDIEGAAYSGMQHFIGTMVYVKSPDSRLSWNEFFVIDGQQRIASIMLLLKVLHDRHDLDERNKQKIWEMYLTNPFAKSDNFKLKLKPIESDSLAWENIINGTVTDENSSNLVKNYKWFKEWVDKSKKTPQEILDAIGCLWVVCLELDPEKERPQVIFESINSTGKSLTQGDLIRNYLLMNAKTSELQNRLYKKYWIQIEQYCKKDDSKLPDFIRDYFNHEKQCNSKRKRGL